MNTLPALPICIHSYLLHQTAPCRASDICSCKIHVSESCSPPAASYPCSAVRYRSDWSSHTRSLHFLHPGNSAEAEVFPGSPSVLLPFRLLSLFLKPRLPLPASLFPHRSGKMSFHPETPPFPAKRFPGCLYLYVPFLSPLKPLSLPQIRCPCFLIPSSSQARFFPDHTPLLQHLLFFPVQLLLPPVWQMPDCNPRYYPSMRSRKYHFLLRPSVLW